MAAPPRETHFALACQHMAAAIHYLAGLAPASPRAPHLLPPLALGPLPHALPPLLAAGPPQHRRQEHRVEIHDEGDDEREDDDNDRENDDDDREDDGVGGNGGADEDEAFVFEMQDLIHSLWPLIAATPPYPLSRILSDADLETAAWVWFLFVNGLVFTCAVTYFSVVMFRSCRHCLPTFLRAMLLAVTLGAETAAAFHLPPDTPLATILSYISIILHVFIYLLTWAAYCFWRRRRLHPLA